MPMTFETPTAEEMVNEGGYLDTPGTYHLCVTEGIEGMARQTAIDGFSLECDVLGGTVEGCEGKKTSLTFFSPKPDGKPMGRKKIGALLTAVNAMDPNDLGRSVNVEIEDLAGEQFVVTLAQQMKPDDNGNYTIKTKFLEVNYADVYHVDDPEVAAVPKDEDAIGMIPSVKRHTADWFGFRSKNKGKSQSVTSKAEADDDPAAGL